jgi:hypothetical protein
MSDLDLLEKLKRHIICSTAMLQAKSNDIAIEFATNRLNPALLGDVVAFDEAVQMMLDQTFHSLDNLLSRIAPTQSTGDLCRALLGIRKNLTEQLHTFERLIVSCGLVEPVTV